MRLERDGIANLINLMSVDSFEQTLVSEPAHPLRVLWERADSARDNFLGALDRAAALTEGIWGRSPGSARSSLQGQMRKRGSYNAAVAQLIAGARLEALGWQPAVADQGGGPDFLCDAAGTPLAVEVKAPGSQVEKPGIAEDLAARLEDTGVGADVSVAIHDDVKPDSGFASQLTRILRRYLRDVAAAGPFPLIVSFSIEAGQPLSAIRFVPGAEGFPVTYPVMGWITCWSASGPTRVTTLHKVKEHNPAAMAEADSSDLYQIRPGIANFLVLDLTWRGLHGDIDWDAYRSRLHRPFERRPQLSAILLTARWPRLKPAPSIDLENVSLYRAIPSPNPDATHLLPDDVIRRLETPGLLGQ
jgi:hypothetical protein